MNYTQLREEIERLLPGKDVIAIAGLFTADNFAEVKKCSGLELNSVTVDSTKIAPTNSKSTVLISMINAATTVDEVVELFTAENVRAADFAMAKAERLLSYEGETSNEADIEAVIAKIDSETANKTETEC